MHTNAQKIEFPFILAVDSVYIDDVGRIWTLKTDPDFRNVFDGIACRSQEHFTSLIRTGALVSLDSDESAGTIADPSPADLNQSTHLILRESLVRAFHELPAEMVLNRDFVIIEGLPVLTYRGVVEIAKRATSEGLRQHVLVNHPRPEDPLEDDIDDRRDEEEDDEDEAPGERVAGTEPEAHLL